MLRKVCFFLVTLSLLLTPFNLGTQASDVRWDLGDTFEVSGETLDAYLAPDIHSQSAFTLYHGMDVEPSETVYADGYRWFKFGGRFWVPAIEPGGMVNLTVKIEDNEPLIEDYYGILDQPHRFAAKLVKFPGATARMETYEKVGESYELRRVYDVSYRKEGEKALYGDLKTVGGHVVRYLYRTTRSSMNGWDASGDPFGVYKTSFPMPHDALPHLLDGKISTYQYNKLPTINRQANGELYPHPASYMGADIVLHTKRKGSRGCLNIKNEEMSFLYHEDMVSELNTEIIPLVIYDEDVQAPPVGELF